ncbi:hypothetical protein BESB_016970 [Besnoitia besnoiti]|uniref:Uncharacterized protein n=1 Tax=Besnoitia besnoiti TaxID=94643 RepID=A0A2A9M365_BESBE|nr:hypothetical protein BESB_016970 [Besnoitia besnoiti]PFH32379.1 hypothetical protein BESB_016970 [Besnoitia besnoiti]
MRPSAAVRGGLPPSPFSLSSSSSSIATPSAASTSALDVASQSGKKQGADAGPAAARSPQPSVFAAAAFSAVQRSSFSSASPFFDEETSPATACLKILGRTLALSPAAPSFPESSLFASAACSSFSQPLSTSSAGLAAQPAAAGLTGKAEQDARASLVGTSDLSTAPPSPPTPFSSVSSPSSPPPRAASETLPSSGPSPLASRQEFLPSAPSHMASSILPDFLSLLAGSPDAALPATAPCHELTAQFFVLDCVMQATAGLLSPMRLPLPPSSSLSFEPALRCALHPPSSASPPLCADAASRVSLASSPAATGGLEAQTSFYGGDARAVSALRRVLGPAILLPPALVSLPLHAPIVLLDRQPAATPAVASLFFPPFPSAASGSAHDAALPPFAPAAVQTPRLAQEGGAVGAFAARTPAVGPSFVRESERGREATASSASSRPAFGCNRVVRRDPEAPRRDQRDKAQPCESQEDEVRSLSKKSDAASSPSAFAGERVRAEHEEGLKNGAADAPRGEEEGDADARRAEEDSLRVFDLIEEEPSSSSCPFRAAFIASMRAALFRWLERSAPALASCPPPASAPSLSCPLQATRLVAPPWGGEAAAAWAASAPMFQSACVSPVPAGADPRGVHLCLVIPHLFLTFRSGHLTTMAALLQKGYERRSLNRMRRQLTSGAAGAAAAPPAGAGGQPRAPEGLTGTRLLSWLGAANSRDKCEERRVEDLRRRRQEEKCRQDLLELTDWLPLAYSYQPGFREDAAAARDADESGVAAGRRDRGRERMTAPQARSSLRQREEETGGKLSKHEALLQQQYVHGVVLASYLEVYLRPKATRGAPCFSAGASPASLAAPPSTASLSSSEDTRAPLEWSGERVEVFVVGGSFGGETLRAFQKRFLQQSAGVSLAEFAKLAVDMTRTQFTRLALFVVPRPFGSLFLTNQLRTTHFSTLFVEASVLATTGHAALALSLFHAALRAAVESHRASAAGARAAGVASLLEPEADAWGGSAPSLLRQVVAWRSAFTQWTREEVHALRDAKRKLSELDAELGFGARGEDGPPREGDAEGARQEDARLAPWWREAQIQAAATTRKVVRKSVESCINMCCDVIEVAELLLDALCDSAKRAASQGGVVAALACLQGEAFDFSSELLWIFPSAEFVAEEAKEKLLQRASACLRAASGAPTKARLSRLDSRGEPRQRPVSFSTFGKIALVPQSPSSEAVRSPPASLTGSSSGSLSSSLASSPPASPLVASPLASHISFGSALVSQAALIHGGACTRSAAVAEGAGSSLPESLAAYVRDALGVSPRESEAKEGEKGSRGRPADSPHESPTWKRVLVAAAAAFERAHAAAIGLPGSDVVGSGPRICELPHLLGSTRRVGRSSSAHLPARRARGGFAAGFLVVRLRPCCGLQGGLRSFPPSESLACEMLRAQARRLCALCLTRVLLLDFGLDSAALLKLLASASPLLPAGLPTLRQVRAAPGTPPASQGLGRRAEASRPPPAQAFLPSLSGGCGACAAGGIAEAACAEVETQYAKRGAERSAARLDDVASASKEVLALEPHGLDGGALHDPGTFSHLLARPFSSCLASGASTLERHSDDESDLAACFQPRSRQFFFTEEAELAAWRDEGELLLRRPPSSSVATALACAVASPLEDAGATATGGAVRAAKSSAAAEGKGLRCPTGTLSAGAMLQRAPPPPVDCSSLFSPLAASGVSRKAERTTGDAGSPGDEGGFGDVRRTPETGGRLTRDSAEAETRGNGERGRDDGEPLRPARHSSLSSTLRPGGAPESESDAGGSSARAQPQDSSTEKGTESAEAQAQETSVDCRAGGAAAPGATPKSERRGQDAADVRDEEKVFLVELLKMHTAEPCARFKWIAGTKLRRADAECAVSSDDIRAKATATGTLRFLTGCILPAPLGEPRHAEEEEEEAERDGDPRVGSLAEREKAKKQGDAKSGSSIRPLYRQASLVSRPAASCDAALAGASSASGLVTRMREDQQAFAARAEQALDKWRRGVAARQPGLIVSVETVGSVSLMMALSLDLVTSRVLPTHTAQEPLIGRARVGPDRVSTADGRGGAESQSATDSLGGAHARPHVRDISKKTIWMCSQWDALEDLVRAEVRN